MARVRVYGGSSDRKKRRVPACASVGEGPSAHINVIKPPVHLLSYLHILQRNPPNPDSEPSHNLIHWDLGFIQLVGDAATGGGENNSIIPA